VDRRPVADASFEGAPRGVVAFAAGVDLEDGYPLTAAWDSSSVWDWQYEV